MDQRRCPRCTFTLVPHPLQGVTLDACPRCRGVFVERAEESQLFGPFGDFSTWKETGAAMPVARGRRLCPAAASGAHGPMDVWRVVVPGGGHVEVDTCPTCRGLWLDAGEARRLTAGRLVTASLPPRAPTQPVEVGSLNAPPPGEEKTGVGWYLLQLFTSVPVEVYNPRRRLPVVCLALIAACTIAFVVEVGLAVAGDKEFGERWGALPSALLRGRNLPSLVTYMFLHGGLAHLAGNAWFLWTFGDNVEDRVGPGRFLSLYVACGVGGGVAHVLLTTTPEVPLVGASGAIAGLLGAYLALFPRAQLYQVFFFIRFKLPVWFYVGGWAALNLLVGLLTLNPRVNDEGVAWWCHVGGFVVGLLWGLFPGRRFRDGAELAVRG
jgi:membrane associated rhomboid family serine protease/Zn-finger nucleic acid-binding protein